MSREFELSRRKILGAVGGVGIASAGAGMGTSAFFSDTESFEGNSMTAGELDLRIDWQQQYYGPSEQWEFVNAHPDHDDDGIQSLDSDEYDTVSDDGEVTYEDNSANIQQYLTCETLENHEPADFSNNKYPDQEHLIELDDVKPGDEGEITFSFHLCDNPGYVWMTGVLGDDLENGQNEAEQDDDDDDYSPKDSTTDSGELADAIEVQAWYDLDCDNEFDDNEGEELLDPVFEWGSLRDVMGDLSSDGTFISPAPYVDSQNDQPAGTSEPCRALGKVEGWDGDVSDITVDDFNGVGSDTETSSTSGEVLGTKDGDSFEVYVLLRNDDTDNETIVKIYNIRDGDGKLADSEAKYENSTFGEPTKFDFETVDSVTFNGETYESDARGICYVYIKAGTQTTTYEVRDGIEECSLGEQNLHPDNDKGISNIVFYYCPGSDVPGTDVPVCFDGGMTYCVGFKWRIPETVGNEIQSDKVTFDLGFYTEQCRHNELPSGPGSS